MNFKLANQITENYLLTNQHYNYRGLKSDDVTSVHSFIFVIPLLTFEGNGRWETIGSKTFLTFHTDDIIRLDMPRRKSIFRFLLFSNWYKLYLIKRIIPTFQYLIDVTDRHSNLMIDN